MGGVVDCDVAGRRHLGRGIESPVTGYAFNLVVAPGLTDDDLEAIEKASRIGDSIRRVIEAARRRFRAAFGDFIDRVSGAPSRGEYLQMASTGDLSVLMNAMDDGVGPLSSAWADAVTQGGYSAAEDARNLAVTIDYDPVNERAVERIRLNRARLVREMTADQRQALAQVIQHGFEQGLNPRVIARDLHSSIGLTARQEQAVANFRRLLATGSREALTRELRDRRFDGTIRRAIGHGRILNPDQIDRMVQRYRERFIRFRAETIARTESLSAANEGAHIAIVNGVEDGRLIEGDVIRTWITASDERRRSSHRAMHGQRRGLRAPFLSGAGFSLLYPGDPNAPASEIIKCRCAVTTRIRRGGIAPR